MNEPGWASTMRGGDVGEAGPDLLPDRDLTRRRRELPAAG